ncbi:MAG: hypothetical protein Q9185_003387 [Variospora sp. 1 TL-2023]
MADNITASQNRGGEVLAVTVALFAAATFAVILRFISRVGVVKRISQDDYAMILAWTSICLFYLTIAKNQPIFKWATVATLVVVNVAGIALTFLNIFQCRPIAGIFRESIPPNLQCIDIIALYLSSAPINISTDLALLVLPMPILTAMRLPRNEKLILLVTFSFGAFVAAVDVVRVAYLQSAAQIRLETGSGSSLASPGDFSWIASLSFMWSAIEVDVGIICACVPGIKPLAARVFPSLLGRIKHARGSSGNHYYGPGDVQSAGTNGRNVMASPPPSPVAARHAPTCDRDGANGDTSGGIDFLTTADINTSDLDRPDTARNEEEDITMVDFLDPPASPSVQKTDTTLTANTTKARKGSLTVFDFVNMSGPKSMVRLSNRESLPSLLFVTFLFFLWGFAYGLLSILNAQFQYIVKVSNAQASGLHAAYFGAYFVAPLTFGRLVLKKWGFRQTFIVGLCVYGTGTLVFWPSAVLLSYPAFLISNFLVGLGVSTLELGGNPFIALCGPPEYSEVRLNISQAVQAIGSVVSPLLAQKVFFKGITDAPSLIDIQWTYLGIALFDVVLALLFFYLPIPEATDEDLQLLADEREEVNTRKIGGVPIVYITLALGASSQFCYVGGQEAVAGVFLQYVDIVQPGSEIGAFNYQMIGHTVFAVGRFLSALAGLLFAPRWILMFLYICLIITSALAMNLTGYAGVAMIILIYLFESGVFSIIFAMCLRGLGCKTRMGSVVLTAATSGGAVIRVVMDRVNKSRGIRYGFSVPVAVFAFGLLLPLYTTIVPAARVQVDPVYKRSDAMAGYGGRKGPNVAHYLANLNAIPSEHDVVTQQQQPDDFDFSNDLAAFTNTEFFDFDQGEHVFQSPVVEFDASNQALDPADTAAVTQGGIKSGEFDFTPQPDLASTPAFDPSPAPGSKRAASATSPGSNFGQEESSRVAAEEDKRRRNTAASARFRVKKKQREQALEKTAKELNDRTAQLEQKIGQLQTQNEWLKNLITEKKGKDFLAEEWKAFKRRAGSESDSGGEEAARSTDEKKKGVGTK